MAGIRKLLIVLIVLVAGLAVFAATYDWDEGTDEDCYAVPTDGGVDDDGAREPVPCPYP